MKFIDNIFLNKIKLIFKQKDYLFFTNGKYNLNIIGIRKDINSIDKFDDVICVIYKDSLYHWKMDVFPATTDTGKHYLQNPMNDKGTAILKPNQYNRCWKIGKHRGKYRALTQHDNVEVYRDNNKDLKMDFKNIESGVFGINIHRASQYTSSKKIGKYSAGCQVIQSAQDWKKFDNLFMKSSKLYGDIFTYTLLEEKDFY